ncbi:hypothetical protein GDO86_003236 [Hymenochirus boettgeri]|uniref:TGF-beta family profile domain-containing protein n=1 Tax=Hymenochirus boettgeri TaxID=247094 RepID=A0A8T2IHS6_9PIPI|nr:hypothetical protein GDO86_019409 [Hymenochirus boettgeri]KAG8429716.1 hypothetical protein GDO86_019408 [Hymenochirus boettgeri]KAG8429717.1 hypothetical protein GDO86_019407 [Hymenochirus boettgeri]KAG8450890.1 hypothetical protein GDO86_003236 [Hymenochirus boettgeri]
MALKASTSIYGTRHSHSMKYPPYIMELYQTLVMGNATDLSVLEHPVLQESDAVLSLISKSCVERDNHWALSFDMSSISSSNELKLAELRIHLPYFVKKRNVTIEIYHTKDYQERLFLGDFNYNPSVPCNSFWKVFNITEMMQNYLYERDHFYRGGYGKDKDMSKRAQGISCTNVVAERVLLVVFTKDQPSASVAGSPSLIKTVESSKYVRVEKPSKFSSIRRHKRNRNMQHSIIWNKVMSRPKVQGKPLCRRVDMVVDFDRIGWGHSIIYPKRFNAFRCEGSCPVPLIESLQPTNHAYIKSLIKLHDSEKVECNSCVPVKMTPLSMLMFDGNKVVLKHHEDMIVEECGCH